MRETEGYSDYACPYEAQREDDLTALSLPHFWLHVYQLLKDEWLSSHKSLASYPGVSVTSTVRLVRLPDVQLPKCENGIL